MRSTRSVSRTFFTLAAASVAMTTPVLAQWVAQPKMPQPRIQHVAAGGTLGGGAGRVFVFGGSDSSQYLFDVDAFDPVLQAWDPPGTYPKMPTARVLAAVAKDKAGKIYIIGGSNWTGALATIDVFDPATATWSTLPSMPTPRFAAGATWGPDGKLYVAGGRDGTVDYSVVERYDPALPGWTTVAPLPAPHHNVGAAAGCGDNQICVVGGRDPANLCSGGTGAATYSYDIKNNKWTTGQSMPGCLGGRGVVRGANDRIYAINDGDYFTLDQRVYSYDPGADLWKQEPSTIAGYTDLAAAALDDKIYAIGGVYKLISDPTRFEMLVTGTTSVCPSPPALCVTPLPGVFSSDRFAAFPSDRMQLIAYYDGNGTAELDIHLVNPAANTCCVLTVTGIANAPLTIQEFDMKGYVPTGKFQIRNVVPNGAIDGVAFGLYWRDASGLRWSLRSRSPASAGGTPNFVGAWPYAWSEANWDALMPQLAGGTFDDFVRRRQAQVALTGAQALGNGVWGHPTGRLPGDTNGDGCVDQQDLANVLAVYGITCCP